MAVRNLQFVLSGQDKSASRVLGNVGKKADGLSAKLSGIGRAASLGVAGVAASAVGGLTAAFIQGVKDAKSYETLAAKTAAVIKSTGNEAHTSVKGVQALAGELESLSGIDEEAIINAENLLLTFTKVRNETGEGNDVFTQATKTIVDMSAALGQDTSASAVQLGKALNDPIKGVSALSKVGVSFTQQQKDQIKQLVETGDTMGAQKVILKELNTEFGGAAKAAGSGLSGALARAKDAFGDLFRNLATPLLPKITEWAEGFSTTVNDKIAPAILNFIDQFKSGKGAGGEFRDFLKDLGGVARDMAPLVQTALEKIVGIVGYLSDHPNVFKAAAVGIGLYWAAMKLAAFHTGVMAAVNLGKIALGVGSIGTTSAAAAPGVAAFGGAAGLAVTPVTAFAGAILAVVAAYAAYKAIAPAIKDLINNPNGSGGSPTFQPLDPQMPGGAVNKPGAPPLIPGLVPGRGLPVYKAPAGSADFPSKPAPTKPPTGTRPENRLAVATIDGKKLSSATASAQQGRVSRGLVYASP